MRKKGIAFLCLFALLSCSGCQMEQKKKGRLVIIASHNNEDIEVLCDEIYYFDKGIVTTEKPVV